MTPMTIPRTVQWFRTFLETQGPPMALSWLNSGVPHRFSAVYRLHDRRFEVLYLYDKQAEVVPAFLSVVPFELSFCQFAFRDGSFTTDDSFADRRLNGLPYQGIVISYHGASIVDSAGEVIGTLCHFDTIRQLLPDTEFALLQGAARAFPQSLMHVGGQETL
jgi:hypothetical protein